MSVEWFKWYTAQFDKSKKLPMYRDRYLCPCCFMPTLTDRAGFDICPICFWEDDGQDSDDAELVRGGPNHDYSLTEARNNFKSHYTMYRPSDTKHFQRESADMRLKKVLHSAHKKAIETSAIEDWNAALSEEDRYHNERN